MLPSQESLCLLERPCRPSASPPSLFAMYLIIGSLPETIPIGEAVVPLICQGGLHNCRDGVGGHQACPFRCPAQMPPFGPFRVAPFRWDLRPTRIGVSSLLMLLAQPSCWTSREHFLVALVQTSDIIGILVVGAACVGQIETINSIEIYLTPFQSPTKISSPCQP